MKVNIDGLAAAVVDELEKYSDDVGEAVQSAVDEVTKNTLSLLRKSSPRKTGDYQKGWRKRIVTSKRGRHVTQLHNATDYQLTHLLEKGHKKTGGGTVRAIPHIAPAEEKAAEQLERLIKEAIQ